MILVNLSNEDFVIENGERIAQLIIAKHERAEWIEVTELSETSRGEGGFGSRSEQCSVAVFSIKWSEVKIFPYVCTRNIDFGISIKTDIEIKQYLDGFHGEQFIFSLKIKTGKNQLEDKGIKQSMH